MKLKNYQLIGLNWLVLMHDQQLNGVLADEMGLGKTVQAISFLGYLKEMGELEHKMCLIVVPTSTLDNWARELSIWLPSVGFLTYHGSQEERKGMRMDIFNDELGDDVGIILTTYNMVTSSPEDKALFKRLSLHTIIYDEAHMLKNMTSQRYENLMKIRCSRRLLLTGTPLQNNLVELMSILIFVMPQLFEGRKEELKKVFSMFPKSESEDSKGRYETERIQQAKRIMAPFFLRRLKEDVLKDLPTKSDEVFHVPMSERQEKMYNTTVQVLSKRAEEMKKELEKMKLQDLEELDELQGTRGSSVSRGNKKTGKKIQPGEDSSSNMLMKLRKLANHPLLLRSIYTDEKINEMAKILKKSTHKESILDYIIEDFSVMSDFDIHQTCVSLQPINKFKLDPETIVQSGKMEKLDEMLPEMKKNGDRVLIFSQFVIVLNLLEEYLKFRGYSYRRMDGSTLVSERQEMIDDFNEDEKIFIFLLSTRAGGLGINLSAANTVILHDIDFNPYNDKQAEDRCHRVGQTRNVKIYRFICKNSIEEGMYQIACNKLQLERDVTGKNEDHRKGDVVALLKTALRVNNENIPE
ncbi:UNVERIFIED_CONTAM: hypothetical protein RMT77_013391 [Armadillidium vulgare]